MQPAIQILAGGPNPILRASDQTVTIGVADPTTGQPASITLAGSTFTLTDPSGIKLVDSAAVTSVTSGRANYSMLAASVPATIAYAEGFREVWSLVIAGVTYLLRRDAALVRQAYQPAVTIEDLYVRHHELRDPSSWPPNQEAVSWLPQINEAAIELTDRLFCQGRRPWLIWTVGSARKAHIYLALSIVFRGGAERDSRWADWAKEYAERYETAWGELQFAYDTSDSAIPVLTQVSATPVVLYGSGPRRLTRWGNRGVWP